MLKEPSDDDMDDMEWRKQRMPGTFQLERWRSSMVAFSYSNVRTISKQDRTYIQNWRGSIDSPRFRWLWRCVWPAILTSIKAMPSRRWNEPKSPLLMRVCSRLLPFHTCIAYFLMTILTLKFASSFVNRQIDISLIAVFLNLYMTTTEDVTRLTNPVCGGASASEEGA